MDIPSRVPAAPVAPGDDPWAGLTVPQQSPVSTDVVLPVMPWDVPDAPMDLPADRAPEPVPVPTAVEAAVPRTAFPPGVSDKLGVYVYVLADARTGRPFHVGRGRGDRCFRHVEAARTVPDPASTDAPTGFPALDRIREAESDGRPVRVEVLRYGLTADQADLVVAAVDDVLALGQTTRLGSQRTPAVELGAALAKRAKLKRSHQAVLLRVGSHGAATDYDRARHGWRIGRRWVDTDAVGSPKWAMLVAGELVEAVYRIDGWEPSPTSGTSSATERWSFVGTQDAELEARYVGRSVSGYFGSGGPSQVTYVRCGPHWVNTAD